MPGSGTPTTNLQLTQYQLGDKPSYIDDYNADMRKIDAAQGGDTTVKDWLTAMGITSTETAQAFAALVNNSIQKNAVTVDDFEPSE